MHADADAHAHVCPHACTQAHTLTVPHPARATCLDALPIFPQHHSKAHKLCVWKLLGVVWQNACFPTRSKHQLKVLGLPCTVSVGGQQYSLLR